MQSKKREVATIPEAVISNTIDNFDPITNKEVELLLRQSYELCKASIESATTSSKRTSAVNQLFVLLRCCNQRAQLLKSSLKIDNLKDSDDAPDEDQVDSELKEYLRVVAPIRASDI